MQSGRKLMTIRSGDWKLIEGKGSGGFTKVSAEALKEEPEGQLYNLAKDPGEENNLFEEMGEVVDRLRFEMAEVIGPSAGD